MTFNKFIKKELFSKKTLAVLDESMRNLEKGKVSEPIKGHNVELNQMTFDDWFNKQKYVSTNKPIAQDAWDAAKENSQIEIRYLKDLIKRMTRTFEQFAELLVEYEQREFPELWQNTVKLPKKGGSKRATKVLKKLRRK